MRLRHGARRLASLALSVLGLLSLEAAAFASTAVPQWQQIFHPAADGTTAAAPLAARELADGTLLVVTKEFQTVHYNHDGTIVSFRQLSLNPPDRRRRAPKRFPADHPDTSPFELVNAHATIDGFGRVAIAVVDQPNYGFLDSGNIETAKFDGLTGESLWPAPQFYQPGPIGSGAYPTGVFLDTLGNVIVTGLFTQPRQVTLKYDGKTGELLWGPIVITGLSSPLWSSTAEVDPVGDVYVSVSDGSATPGGITTVKYSGADGSSLGSTTFFPGDPEVYPEVSTIDADGHYIYAAFAGGRIFTVKIGDFPILQWASAFDPPAGATNAALTSVVTDAISKDVFVSSRYDVSGAGTSTTQRLSGATGDSLWTGASIPVVGAYQPVQSTLASNGDLILGSPLGTSSDLRLNFWRFRGADGAPFWGPTEIGSIDSIEPAQFFVGSNGRIFTSELAVAGSDRAVSSGEIDAATGVVAWGPTPATFPHVDLARAWSLAAGPDADPVATGFIGIGESHVVTFKYDRVTGTPLWGPVVYAPADAISLPAQIAVDASNDVFVFGFNQNLNPLSYQSFVIKYSGSTGAVLWGPVFLDNIAAVALAVDPAGNAIVLASTIDLVGGLGHVAIAKIAGASGSTLWGPVVFVSDPSEPDYGNLLSLDTSGDALVVGNTLASGVFSWFALKYSGSDGSLSWGPSSGSLGLSYAAAVDASGNLAVSGNDENGQMTTIEYSGLSGAILWGPVHAPGVGGAVAVAPNGDVVASGDVLNPSGTQVDFSTIRYASGNGSVVWGPVVTDAAGGDDVPFAQGLAFDSSGNVVLGGTSQTFVRNNDIALLKYDGTTGATLWGPVLVGGSDAENLQGLDVRGDSIVVGATSQAGMLTAMLDESLGIQTPGPTLPPGFCGEAYSVTFVAENGAPAYTWSVISGNLPPGLSLSAAGAVTGTPTEQGSFSFTVRVSDSALDHADRAFTLVVTDDPTGYAILAFPGAPCHFTLAVTTGSWTSYLWLPGGETTPEIDVAPIETTTYGVVLGDGSGCMLRLSVTLGGTGYEDPACLAPSVVSIAPTSGPASGGTAVTITGAKFEPGVLVAIGGEETAATTVDPSHITATTPALIAGALASVLVRNTDTGTAFVPGLFFADFLDVPPSNVFHDSVEALVRSGVTVGCGSGLFCIDQDTTRAQMAVFLLRSLLGLTYNPPLPTGGIFADVSVDTFAAAFIEDLYARGITGGCLLDPLRYCPDANVTRAEMAVFLLKTLLGKDYAPPPATGTVFADVAADAFAAPWIEDLYNRGITAGCLTDPLRYCPDRPVSRGEMAAFLVLTFNL